MAEWQTDRIVQWNTLAWQVATMSGWAVKVTRSSDRWLQACSRSKYLSLVRQKAVRIWASLYSFPTPVSQQKHFHPASEQPHFSRVGHGLSLDDRPQTFGRKGSPGKVQSWPERKRREQWRSVKGSTSWSQEGRDGRELGRVHCLVHSPLSWSSLFRRKIYRENNLISYVNHDAKRRHLEFVPIINTYQGLFCLFLFFF